MAGQVVPHFVLPVGRGPLQGRRGAAGRAGGECFSRMHLVLGITVREAAMSVLELLGGR